MSLRKNKKALIPYIHSAPATFGGFQSLPSKRILISVCIAILAVATVCWFERDRGFCLARDAVELVDPAFFDPPYENLASIKIGITESEVEKLLAHFQRPPDPECSHCTFGERWGSRFHRWEGTRGTITVSFQLREVAGKEIWCVVGKDFARR